MIRDLIYKNIYLPKRYSKLGTDPLKFLMDSDKWSREKLDSFTLNTLRSLAANAKKNTSYYKSKFKDSEPEKLTIEDFKKLEKLTKEQIRKDPKAFRSDSEANYVKASSSGSTGEPMTIYRSALADAFILASHFRFHSWHGIKPNAKHIIIWGTGIAPEPDRSFLKKAVKDNLVNVPLVINVFDLNESTISKYKKLIEEYDPVYIRGYTSSVKHLCTLLGKNNLNVKLKAAIVTSEICLPEDKQFISDTLNCRTLEEYGSRDGGQYAYECPEGSLHIQEELTHFFTDENNEVVSTELHNTTMPMFNYQPGDKVVIGESCSCGRSSRTITAIEGRVSDYILKEDGSKLSSWIIFYLLKDLENSGFKDSVSQMQLIQNGNKFNVNLVKGKQFIDPESFITQYLKEKIGGNINIDYSYLIEIPKEKSGKVRTFKRIS